MNPTPPAPPPTQPETPLLPCPFCESADIKIVRDTEAYAITQFVAVCECGACAPNAGTRDLAKAEWNTRATTRELSRLRDEAAQSREEVAELAEIRGCVDWGAINAGRATALSEVRRTIVLLKETQGELAQLKVKHDMITADNARLRDVLRAVEADKVRLDWLEKAILSMPDLQIVFSDDGDTEDDIGMIPKGWNIRVNSICAEPLALNAPTFREAIDKAAALGPQPEGEAGAERTEQP